MKRLLRNTGFILTAIACLYFKSLASDLKIFFSPKGGCLDAIIYEIDRAKRKIDVAMYAFTSRPIAQALVRAVKRGVRVRVVLDKKFATENSFSKHVYLAKRGVSVKLVSPPPDRGRVGLMHHKFAVIDESTVLTGSFNWTAAAEYLNYETLMVFHSPAVAEIFEKEFERLWR